MADPPAAAPAVPAPPAADGAGPWHSGVEPETLGFWQNKGWAPDNPKDFALNITKSYRDMEKHFGTSAEQLLKMPKADAPPAEIKAFWQRLGAPQAPAEYDFSSVKFADGSDLDDGFAATMRDALAQAYVPKDKASSIISAVVKFMENADIQDKTLTTTKLAEEKAKLAENWKANFDFNHLKAMEGARRLGITPEAVKALENQIGYAAVMEAMRKIGAGTTEDMFVDRGASHTNGPGGTPATREGAIARLEELKADRNWRDSLLSGNKVTEREFQALLGQIDGTE